MAPRVVRIPRTDEAADAFVLVKVESAGSLKLDLQLIGTDGSSPFVGQVKHNSAKKLRAKTYNGSDEDLIAALGYILLHDDDVEKPKDVEAIANVDNDLHIVIRKNIGGITQRIATITLQQNDDVEIELFEWTAQAAASYDTARSTLSDLQASMKEQQLTVERLNSQLDDLVKAKKEHESQLIQKFAELLNAKKLKIRDQQRLLSNASIDPKFAEQVRGARESITHKAGDSRKGKRKAESEEDESEDGFEVSGKQQDLDEEELREELNEQATPEASDQDETEDEDEEGVGPKSRDNRTTVGVGRRGKALDAEETTAGPTKPSKPLTLPPRRELPFVPKTTEKSASPTRSGVHRAATPSDQGEETDDEL
ncbi:hypothetical protein MBLNU457_3575t1 [Dothideomycetes sp. NU457]